MPALKPTLAALATSIGLGAVVFFGFRERAAPQRCGAGLVALGARCCPEGQRLEGGHCAGAPRACPSGFRSIGGARPGCVARPIKLAYAGGSATVGPNDWEASERATVRTIRVAAFQLDGAEVDHARWSACADAGQCRRLAVLEPGLPVTSVSAAEAEAFCKFAGGRLPSSDEWMFAAAGPGGRRFAWGPTGLVCRRAVYGLVSGPCSDGGATSGPELPGSRPDGATPEGAWDLAGNVAEWTREADGSFVARGGSYASRLAAELKTWSFERVPGPSPHVGLRCAY